MIIGDNRYLGCQRVLIVGIFNFESIFLDVMFKLFWDIQRFNTRVLTYIVDLSSGNVFERQRMVPFQRVDEKRHVVDATFIRLATHVDKLNQSRIRWWESAWIRPLHPGKFIKYLLAVLDVVSTFDSHVHCRVEALETDGKQEIRVCTFTEQEVAIHFCLQSLQKNNIVIKNGITDS